MTSDNDLQKVKKFRLVNIRKILGLIFFSCLGTICGAFLWYQILYLTDFKTNIPVPLLTGIGTAIGFYIGNLVTRYSENNVLFFVLMLISSILHIPIIVFLEKIYK
jgi:uncharacterized membrane protein YfcA